MIPKIIHYCWFGPKPYSRTVKKCIRTWHQHLSDYEFCLWNEQTCADYAAEHNLPNPMEHPFVQSAYAARKYAFVADYVRFWALYNYGGIYLDTDMYVVRSFNPLLDNNFFCGWETAEGTATNGGKASISCGALGACALGACARDILMKYDTLVFDADHLDRFIVPRIITPVLLQHNDEITIYPYDFFYPFPFSERTKSNFQQYITSNTYAVHLWDISWYPWHKKCLRQIVIELKKIRTKMYA
ncbi:MAG: glycosyltransferase [Paludibacteraceae bacterium]